MKKKILILGIISMVYIIFFPLIYHNIIYKQYMFMISSTGEKNEKSLGSEVWINRIIIDGRDTELSQYVLGDGWENRGRLFSQGFVESDFVLNVHANDRVIIEFISHPYSGIVSVKDYNGNVDRIDLFSDIEGYIIKEFIIDK